jgi:hypothetical protein
VQLLWKGTWKSLKKLKIELPFSLAIPLLGIYLKKCTPRYDRATFISMFIAVLFIVAQLWK